MITATTSAMLTQTKHTKEEKEKNLELAFSTATSLGITQLLDVEDMFLATPDKFSVMTYLRCQASATPPPLLLSFDFHLRGSDLPRAHWALIRSMQPILSFLQ